jgi:hypothetical protein
MDVGATGSRTDAGVPLTLEVIATLPSDTVLVRYAHAQHSDIVWYTREAVVDGALHPLCHRCAHERADHAQHCRDAERALTEVEAERTRRRIAVRPAPEGARYLRHCDIPWRASIGGTCPTCGADGEVFAPEVRIRDARAAQWTNVDTVEVAVYAALVDAGLAPTEARAIDAASAIVHKRGGVSRAAEIITALTAAGWRVVKVPASRRAA